MSNVRFAPRHAAKVGVYAFVTVFFSTLLFAGGVYAGDEITLRVNDAEGEPGAVVAVVVRTYAPRGMEQGQVCLTTTGQNASALVAGIPSAEKVRLRPSASLKSSTVQPFVALEGFEVFSGAGDAVAEATFDAADQTVFMQFSSPSGTVNLSDGPMAVFYFRLDPSLAEGDRFDVAIDFDETFLIDDDGEDVTVEPRPGRLEVRWNGGPLRFEGLRRQAQAGSVAEIGVETFAGTAIGAGEIAFNYDPAFAAGTPQVVMDSRYGASSFTVDTSIAGQILVSFESLDGSLNSVPGEIVTIEFPAADLSDGSKTPVVLDPLLTWMSDPQGVMIPLDLKDGELELKD